MAFAAIVALAAVLLLQMALAHQPLISPTWLEGWRRADPPGAAGRGGLKPPDALVAWAAANGLVVADTVTNGDCGLDAFWQSSSPHHQLRKEPWSSVRKLSKPDAMLALRRLAADWIKEHHKQALWADFSIGDLVRATSPDRTVEAYIARMRKPQQWADTGFIHALACAFGVDLLVFQAGSDVTLLGSSLMGHDVTVAVPVCLQNDLHFWSLKPEDDAKLAWVDKGDGLSPPVPQACHSMSQADQDDHDVEPADVALMAENALDAELSLCAALCKWDPWSVPSDAVMEALTKLASTRDQCSVPLPRLAAARQLVLEEMSEEAAGSSSQPTNQHQPTSKLQAQTACALAQGFDVLSFFFALELPLGLAKAMLAALPW